MRLLWSEPIQTFVISQHSGFHDSSMNRTEESASPYNPINRYQPTVRNNITIQEKKSLEAVKFNGNVDRADILTWTSNSLEGPMHSRHRLRSNARLSSVCPSYSRLARRSETTPRRQGTTNGTAGIPAINPGTVYQGADIAAGSGN